MLTLARLTRRFAGLVAVDDVSLEVPDGGVHALIGPNGAGKTTLFNLISGLVAPSAGCVRLGTTDITELAPERRAALGLSRTFQNIRIFAGMSALENVLTGLHPRTSAGLAAVLLRGRRFRAEERSAVDSAREALALAGLEGREREAAGALSYGDQRRLEIARAVAGGPRLLLLDEPAAGMNPAETEALSVLVRRLAARGITVLLVEHDMGFVMGIADSVAVLNFGRLIFRGPANAARADPLVIEAYLGHKVAARLADGVRAGVRGA